MRVKPTVSCESRLSRACGPCQGQLFLADAAHDLCLPDWDSSTALLQGDRLAKSGSKVRIFSDQRIGEAALWQLANQRPAHAGAVRQAGVQAKSFLVTSACAVLAKSSMPVHCSVSSVVHRCLVDCSSIQAPAVRKADCFRRGFLSKAWKCFCGHRHQTNQAAASSALQRHSQMSACSGLCGGCCTSQSHSAWPWCRVQGRPGRFLFIAVSRSSASSAVHRRGEQQKHRSYAEHMLHAKAQYSASLPSVCGSRQA